MREYILVGGQADGAYGAERPTYDLDICAKWLTAAELTTRRSASWPGAPRALGS